MTDHATLPVKNLEKDRKYYDATLACLGYECLITGEFGEFLATAYSRNGNKSLEFGLMQLKNGSDKSKEGKFVNTPGLHIGLGTDETRKVDEWHKKCIELGATDNGKPGLRFPGHYSAYIIDPYGWHTEAVCHTPVE